MLNRPPDRGVTLRASPAPPARAIRPPPSPQPSPGNRMRERAAAGGNAISSHTLRCLRRHCCIKLRMLGPKGVEPWHQFGKIAAPGDLTAQVEVAEHAG